MMNIYQKSIIEVTGCAKEDAPEVEDLMRHVIFHSTLDWQNTQQFNEGAKEAYGLLQYMRSPEGITYLQQMND